MVAVTVDALLETLQRQFSIQRASQLEAASTLPSGDAALDTLLGGGWLRGHVNSLSGAPTSGATTLALRSVAAVQERGEIAVLIDAQGRLNPAYLAGCGVRLDDLLTVQPPLAGVWRLVADIARTPVVSLLLVAGKVPPLPVLLRSSRTAVLRLHAAAPVTVQLRRRGWQVQESGQICGVQSLARLTRHPYRVAGQTAALSIPLAVPPC